LEKKKKLFLDHFKTKKVWKFFFDKYKKSYKNSLQLKNSWQIYTDNIFKNKKLKKKILETKITREFKVFLKVFFRIDLFLCKIKIAKNRLEAKNFILNGLIIINGYKVLDERFYIKQGDTIFIDPKLCLLKSCLIKRFEYPLEIDFYSNIIVISKNLELTSSLDFAFLKFDKVPYRKLYNFLKSY
jgi:ribosomal protein S4